MKIARKLILSFILVTLLAGCNGYEQLLKSNDFEAKYQAALKFYNQNNYTKAIQLFENLIVHYHGKEHAEDIAWYYSKSLLKEHDYYTAGYQFKNFSKRYPYSRRAEEALYQSAICKYHESPDYYLDQRSTKEAIAEFEKYLELYPQSIHTAQINNYLDELRGKLMKKDYELAVGYYTIESYHAAYVSLQAFLNLYPESQYREQAMFYMLRSGYEYGINSQESKMTERLQQVINDFDRFATSFSNSEYLAEAQEIYTKSKAALAQLESIEKNKK